MARFPQRALPIPLSTIFTFTESAPHGTTLSREGFVLRRLSIPPCVAILFLLITSVAGLGQQMGSTVQTFQYDTIDLPTLGILFNLPLRSKPGMIPFSVSMGGRTGFATTNNGWVVGDSKTTIYSTPYFGKPTNSSYTLKSCGSGYPKENLLTGWVYMDEGGIKHSFPSSMQMYANSVGQCQNTTHTAPASDGSGYILTLPTQVITRPDGSTLNSRTSWTDANGNTVTQASNGTNEIFTDSLNQTLLSVPLGSSSPSAFYTDASSNQKNYTSSLSAPVTQRTNWGCGGISEMNNSGAQFVSGITLPDNSSVGFTYETTPGYPSDYTGRLASMTLPTGGTITYYYSGNPSGCTNPGVYVAATMYDNLFTGAPPVLTRTTSEGTWTFSIAPSTTSYVSTTTVQDLTYDSFNTYTWNAYGKLTSARNSNSPAVCGTTGTCITYDALGRAVETNASGTYTEILYSPLGKTATMNVQNTVSSYLGLPGGATLYSTGTGTANMFFQHKDWLGTVRLESSLSRTVTYDRAFAPFGEMYDNFGVTTQLNFTGDTQDIFAGLFDTPNREYNPAQGRWLSPDPARAGWNQYAYANNDPVDQSDPSGLCGEGVTLPGPGALGGAWCFEFQGDVTGVLEGYWMTSLTPNSTPQFQVTGITLSGGDTLGIANAVDDMFRFLNPDWAPSLYGNVNGHAPGWVLQALNKIKRAQNNAAVQVVQDTVVGGAKEVANTVIDLSNAVNKPIDALLSNFTSFQFGQIPEFQGSTTGEKSAMAGVFIASFFTGAGEEKAATKIGTLTADAEKLYPKLAGKFQEHHIIPQYLGGAKDGATASIPAAYHQLITNEFRALAPYGQKIQRSTEEVGRILQQVYSKYPLP